MEEVAPAPATTPTKAAKKKSNKPRKPGASVSELNVKAVAASKERKGVSLAALKNSLAACGNDVDKNKGRVKLAVKSLVTKGTLVQTKGTGASGSFKMNTKSEAKPKAAAKVKRVKKPAAKTPVVMKASAPKKAAAKKPAAKKSPKKPAKKATTPKKAAKKPIKSSKKAAKKVPKSLAKKAPKKK
ncbi:LOW QUALITY PROTEIN: histone H1-like [Dunckerocampus dactyliophorus]|uniref:LOW QUALITY PROTEIN: histone H1-like n=1 Tax=Dunckerocampus dactyliophorus TaxID=161453 RepID=UPI0024054A1B|nr:LOW QUALITY PROTEIN: histone H1-like [Dunckerocampus dactyliophorus]